mmetsp:Transcript_87073/g.244214  ORF Transcript_87073/g.244214 Transcript_87073/m.244214 type:complete len:255 (-) Transcript_87073:1908-2672(-)
MVHVRRNQCGLAWCLQGGRSAEHLLTARRFAAFVRDRCNGVEKIADEAQQPLRVAEGQCQQHFVDVGRCERVHVPHHAETRVLAVSLLLGFVQDLHQALRAPNAFYRSASGPSKVHLRATTRRRLHVLTLYLLLKLFLQLSAPFFGKEELLVGPRPKAQLLVASRGDDKSCILGQRERQDLGGVAAEGRDQLVGVAIPKFQLAVPSSTRKVMRPGQESNLHHTLLVRAQRAVAVAELRAPQFHILVCRARGQNL